MKKYFKNYKLIFIVLIISIITMLVLLYFFGILKIGKSSILIETLDEFNKPIHNVRICIDEKCSYTDTKGEAYFELNNSGRFLISYRRNNFTSENISKLIYPGANNYSQKLSSTKGYQIRDISTDQTITNFEIYEGENLLPSKKIDNNKIEISQIFDSKEVLTLKTPDYKDVLFRLNDLNKSEIKLEPAADIEITAKSFLYDVNIDNFQVEIKDMTKSSINGQLILRDLPLNEKIEIVTNSEEYNSNNMEIYFEKKGMQEPLEITLSSKGRIYFVKEVNNRKQIFESNIDGSDILPITNNIGDNFGLCFIDQKKMYYLTTKDGAKTTFGFNIPLLYEYDTETKKHTKISKNNYPNFENIGEYNCNTKQRLYNKNNSIFLGNIDGTNNKEVIKDIEGEIIDYKLSSEPNHFAYLVDQNDGFALYQYNGVLETNKQIGKSDSIKLFAYENNRIYYQIESDGQYLLRSLSTHSNQVISNIYRFKETLATSPNEFDLVNVYGNYLSSIITYVTEVNGQKTLYKKSTFEQNIPIYQGNDIDWSINYDNEYTYIGINNNLFINANGTNIKKVIENVENPILFDNYFYL